MRSMVEGWLALKIEGWSDSLASRANYPSTTLRVVPLPAALRRGG
jgi:hypothetical protein